MTDGFDKTLLARLAAKHSLKIPTLQKRIQRRASREGISTRAALIVEAREAKIGIARLLSKESPDIKSEIRATLAKSPITRTRLPAKPGSRTVNLRIRNIDIDDPLLPHSVLLQAKFMSESVYPLIYILENSIREFIGQVESKKHGRGWWDVIMTRTKALSDIQRKVVVRMGNEHRQTWHGKREPHPIHYTDFEDLVTILRSNASEFRPFFHPFRRGVDWLADKMEEVTPSRNITAHHNPLAKSDLDRLIVVLRDWQSHIKTILEELKA